MRIVDPATARAMLDLIVLNGGKLRLVDGSTTICDITLPDPATSAASGTGGVGTRTKEFLGEPLSSTSAAAATTDNGTALVVQGLNSSDVVIVDFTCTINGQGGEFTIAAPGHAGNTTKPNLALNQTIPLQAGAAMNL